MRYLRQNTNQRVTVGPFLDKTTGIDPELALTATNEALTFIVDDAGVPTLVIDTTATGAGGGVNDLVHITNDNAGYYDLELTNTQTNYVGRAVLSINYATDHLPVFHEFMIMPSNVYDSMFGTDYLQVDVTQFGGAAGTNASGRPEVNMTHIAGSAVSTSTAQLGVNAVQAGGTAWGSGAITAGAIATGAIDADALAADAGTEIAAAVLGATVESEGTVTLAQATRLMLSVLAGVTTVSGATYVTKSSNGVATRVTFTLNASKERTAVTLNP